MERNNVKIELYETIVVRLLHIQWKYGSFFYCHISTMYSFLQVQMGRPVRQEGENLEGTIEHENGVYVHGKREKKLRKQ